MNQDHNKNAKFNPTRFTVLMNCVLIKKELAPVRFSCGQLPERASLFIQDDCDPGVVNHMVVFVCLRTMEDFISLLGNMNETIRKQFLILTDVLD